MRVWSGMRRFESNGEWFSMIGRAAYVVVNSCLLPLELLHRMLTLLLAVCDLLIKCLVDETLSNELFDSWVQSYFIVGLLFLELLVCVFFWWIENLSPMVTLWILLSCLIKILSAGRLSDSFLNLLFSIIRKGRLTLNWRVLSVFTKLRISEAYVLIWRELFKLLLKLFLIHLYIYYN